MKKTYLFAFGLAVAISFWGINAISPFFYTYPVAVAQTGHDPYIAVKDNYSVKAVNMAAVFPTPTPPPTITPAFPQPAFHPTPYNTPMVPQQGYAPTQAAPVINPAAPVQPVSPAQALSNTDQASLNQLIASVANQQASQVVGVFVPQKLSLPVFQQPAGDTSYVSTQPNTVTQFAVTNAYGTIGLLAHNFLSGSEFFELNRGDTVYVVYGNGRTEEYVVSRVDRFQALSPTDIYSNFVDLANPGGANLSSTQVFYREYANGNQVVFQTCIDSNGDSSWGRLFITADKVAGS